MSKTNINTKSNVYIRDKEAFLKELKNFHDSKGLPFRYPVVNGQEIDLYLLHLLVIQRGGLSKLNNQGGWESLLRLLHLPSSCVNGAALLRRIYSNCLERYERTRGPPGREDDYSLDADDDGRRGRGGGGPRVAQNYSSAAAEAARTSTKVAGPSERLALSLLSPMPNEQDFAVNVCTVLAADTANRLPLSTTPHVLDFLLAHAGVYNHPSLRDTIGRSYKEARGVSPDVFWVERAGGGGARELADERKFPAWGPGAETSGAEHLAAQALAAHIALSDRLKDGAGGLAGEGKVDAVVEEGDDETDALWVCEQRPEEEVFAPRVAGGARCVLTQRVLQVASIVRSLSFHEENLPILAKHTTLLRFVLLCANCWVGTLRQSGLDTLGNVSQELVIKDPSTCLLSRHILSTVLSALTSTDRARMLAALELLNKLAQNEANEDVLLRCLEGKVYEAVCSLLTLRDIMLLVSTLECVYALTALGERACEHVARVSGLVHTLVSLVTVEAQSYGPKACILMRVVETVSGAAPVETAAPPPPPPTPAPAAQVTPPAPPPAPTPSVTHHHHHVPQPVPQAPAPRPVEVPAVVPQQPVVVSQRASTPQPPPVPPPAPSTVQQQHAHQQAVQENEQFAQAWLRAAWEPFASTTSGSEAAELYRQYLACCSKVGRKGVIGPMHFPRLVRSVFGGTVGPNTINNSNGDVQQIYIGIRVRAMANRTPPISTTGPASPILKAQLTSKAEQMKVQASQGQPTPTPHPHLNQVLETAAAAASVPATPVAPVPVASTNTTLIKHLLAHKVSGGPPPLMHTNDSMLRMQVTQRQNQQRMMGQQHQQSGSMAAVVVQANPAAGMEVDPEALIKCTTITSGGVTSTSPQPSSQPDKIISLTPQQISNLMQQSGDENISIMQKEELQQALQADDGNAQINLKAVQNKMLADLLEKKSTPPVQVIQMAPSLGGQTQAAPTIQIMENGQIIQVQSDASDQQVETVIVDSGTVVGDHSYTQEPPAKKKKGNENEGAQEIVSSTAANLYAALAASALEDEEDLLIQQMGKKEESMEVIQVQQQSDQPPVISIQEIPQQSMQIQQPTLQVQQPTLQVQQPTLQVQQPTLQVQQPTLQVQQPTLQVQQPTLQQLQQSNLQMQQLQQSTLQLQPSTMQMQQTIQVQQPTMQVQQPVLQVQPMDMPMQSAVIQVSQSGQIILQEKPIVSQTQFIQQQPVQLIATSSASQGGLSYIQSNVMQPHKTIIIVQGGGGGSPITLTVNNPGGLDESTLNSLITQASEAITQQHGLSLQSTPGVIQQTQRLIQTSVGQPTVIQTSGILGAHTIKQALMQNPPQLTPSQQPLITSQPAPMKPQLSGQQLLVGGQKQGLVQGGSQQIVMSSQQVDQLMSGAQQILTQVGGQTQLVQGELVNGGQQVVSVGAQPHLVAQSRAPTHSRIVQNVVSNAQLQNVPQTVESQGVIQKVGQQQQQSVKPTVTRQIISRQPVMVGNHKIGEKQTMGTVQTGAGVQDARSTPSPKPKPLLDDQPWMCHWRGCSRVFENASAVFGHAARTHCPASATVETPCLWSDCDRVPRRTFALLNHLHDRHCTAEALKATHTARRHAAAEGESKSSVALGYPPNAALAALNKHAVDLFNPRELMDDNEGPVTKSIRLTAALILRNIVIYSNTGRRQLRSYEPHLSSIALSSVEASRTIAQVLYDMNNI